MSAASYKIWESRGNRAKRGKPASRSGRRASVSPGGEGRISAPPSAPRGGGEDLDGAIGDIGRGAPILADSLGGKRGGAWAVTIISLASAMFLLGWRLSERTTAAERCRATNEKKCAIKKM